MTALAHSGCESITVTEGVFHPVLATKSKPPVTRIPIQTMTEPRQLRGIQRRLPAEHQNIPSGVIQAVLMHALQLRRSCREVFLLCDIQHHSLPEAAQILGISRAAATRRLRLARGRMDEVIEQLCKPAQQSD
jgi:DNA-directed RNA polymerase specialized sigma24 family protein